MYSSFPSRDLSFWRVAEYLADQVDTRALTSVSFSGVIETVIFRESNLRPSQFRTWDGVGPCGELLVLLVWLARPVDDESIVWQCVHQQLLPPKSSM